MVHTTLGDFYGGAIIRITADSWHPVFDEGEGGKWVNAKYILQKLDDYPINEDNPEGYYKMAKLVAFSPLLNLVEERNGKSYSHLSYIAPKLACPFKRLTEPES